MKTLYSTNLLLDNLTKEKYDKLLDFLENNNITYNEKEFEEYIIDTRTEEEKYEDWLSEQADVINDKKIMEA